MAEEPIVLVDVSYVMYKAFYAVCSHWARRGTKVTDTATAMDSPEFARQLRAGLMRDLSGVLKTFKTRRAFLVNDCHRCDNWRVAGGASEGYKGSRAQKTRGVDARLHEMLHQDVLPALCAEHPGLRVLAYPGAEADDVIAVLKTHWAHEHPTARFVIVTNDGDYAQLHDTRTRIVNLQGVDVYERERAKFVTELGEPCNPGILLTAKALRGDKSDDVPPVCQRLRRSVVRQLLDDPVRLAELEAGPHGAAYAANRRLVDLGLVPEELRAGIIAAHCAEYAPSSGS